MKNKSVSDFVATTMDAVLNSREHQSLFGGTYKYASSDEDKNNAKMSKPCKTCKQKEDMCMCAGGYMADDGMSDDHMMDNSMSYDAEDGMDMSPAMSHMSEEMASTAAFDVAIDGLLTASAALDAVGMSNSSTVSLKLASLIVEAKKVVKEEKKNKKKSTKNKKLTSADFKKMHEEDDDGKLTSANFKKMLAKKSK